MKEQLWCRSLAREAKCAVVTAAVSIAKRLPPCSTLFPYTTLFRSRVSLARCDGIAAGRCKRPAPEVGDLHRRHRGRRRRSEEHTSELQSRQYLVCRLLLEKKNSRRRAGGRPRDPTHRTAPIAPAAQ